MRQSFYTESLLWTTCRCSEAQFCIMVLNLEKYDPDSNRECIDIMNSRRNIGFMKLRGTVMQDEDRKTKFSFPLIDV